MHPRPLALCLFLLHLGVAPAVAQEWTQFRGPGCQGKGQAPNLPAKLTEKHIRWRVPVGGRGNSSPVLYGDRLYITREGEKEGTRTLVCFDAGSGKEIWDKTFTYEPHRQHRMNSCATSTPTVDADGVYLAWTSGPDLVAQGVDHEGELMWERKLGKYYAGHGSGSSPVLHQGLLIVANENEGKESFLIALEPKTGKTRWRIPRTSSKRRAVFGCPVSYTRADGSQWLLFASTVHGLTAVDAEAGKVVWEIPLGFKERCVATPCVSDKLAFFSTGSGGSGRECAFVTLPQKEGEKPKVAHALRKAIPYVPSGIFVKGHFFLFTERGVVTCKAEDGTERWRSRIDGSFFSSPVTNGKVLYVADREGVLYTIEPTGEKLEIVSTLDLGSAVLATPALAQGALFLRTADHLMRLENVRKVIEPASASGRRKD